MRSGPSEQKVRPDRGPLSSLFYLVWCCLVVWGMKVTAIFRYILCRRLPIVAFRSLPMAVRLSSRAGGRPTMGLWTPLGDSSRCGALCRAAALSASRMAVSADHMNSHVCRASAIVRNWPHQLLPQDVSSHACGPSHKRTLCLARPLVPCPDRRDAHERLSSAPSYPRARTSAVSHGPSGHLRSLRQIAHALLRSASKSKRQWAQGPWCA